MSEQSPLIPLKHKGIHYNDNSDEIECQNDDIEAQGHLKGDFVALKHKWRRLFDVDCAKSTALEMAHDTLKEMLKVELENKSEMVMHKKDKHFRERRIRIASSLIKDAIHGRKIGYRLDHISLKLHNLYHSVMYTLYFNILLTIYLGLSFFESPGSNNVVTVIMEGVCLLLLFLDVLIRWKTSSSKTRQKFRVRQPWAYLRTIMLVLTTLDLLVHLLCNCSTPRFSRLLRPFLIIARKRNARVIFASCLRAFTKIISVLFFLGFVICFWGFIGCLLFSGYSNDNISPNSQEDEFVHTDAVYFKDLLSSIYTMFLIHTSIPYMSKVMYPYMLVSEWSAIFFVAFVLLTNLFLVKLVISVSYKSYKQHTKDMYLKRLQKRKVALQAAYHLLSGALDLYRLRIIRNSIKKKEKKYGISLGTWIRVTKLIRKDWSALHAKLIYQTADIDNVGRVGLQDFYQLCSLLSAQIERDDLILKHSSSRSCVFQWRLRLKIWLVSGKIIRGYPIVYSEVIIGFFIVLSIYQSIHFNEADESSWGRIFGFLLLFVFTLEIIMKLFTFGVEKVFRKPFGKLDLLTALVGWGFYIFTYFTPNAPHCYYSLAVIIRALRLFKLLHIIPHFRGIFKTMHSVFPLVFRLTCVIFGVIYAFSIVAHEIYQAPFASRLSNPHLPTMFPMPINPNQTTSTFSRSINPNQTTSTFPMLINLSVSSDTIPIVKSLRATMNSTEENFSNECCFRFDSFSQTALIMLQVAVLSGWKSVMDKAVHVTSTYSSIFFFIYRITLSSILLPISVGFVVEAFVTHSKKVEGKKDKWKRKKTIYTKKDQTDNDENYPSGSNVSNSMSFSGKNSFNENEKKNHMNYEMKEEMDDLFSHHPDLEDTNEYTLWNTGRSHSDMFDVAEISDAEQFKRQLQDAEKELVEKDCRLRKSQLIVLQMRNERHVLEENMKQYENKILQLEENLKGRSKKTFWFL